MPGEVEAVTWDTLVGDRMGWRQGQHVTMVGPTGSGKTTLTKALLPLREYVMFFGTKPSGRDDTAMELISRRRRGAARFRLVQDVGALPDRVTPSNGRIMFWPRYRTPSDRPMQSWQIDACMRRAFTEGSWTLVLDELWYMNAPKPHGLDLGGLLSQLWVQGRSLDLTLVAGTQRPRHVPLLAYDQATHLFFWRDNDVDNLKRISGLNGLNSGVIRSTVSTLPEHAVLYVNTRTGYMATTKAPRS